MSAKIPAAKKRAKKARRARHTRRMRAAAAIRKAEECRFAQPHRGDVATDSYLPGTTGLSDDEAARVWGEYFYWEDYAERNPESTFAAPITWPTRCEDAPPERKRRRRRKNRAQEIARRGVVQP